MLVICSSVHTYFWDLEVMVMALLFFFPYMNQYVRIKSAGQTQDIEKEPLSDKNMYCLINFKELAPGNLSMLNVKYIATFYMQNYRKLHNSYGIYCLFKYIFEFHIDVDFPVWLEEFALVSLMETSIWGKFHLCFLLSNPATHIMYLPEAEVLWRFHFGFDLVIILRHMFY